MLEVTIFYILASVLLGLTIVLTIFSGYYLIKIFKNISDASQSVKIMIVSFKERMGSVSAFLTGLFEIVERFSKKKSPKEKKGQE